MPLGGNAERCSAVPRAYKGDEPRMLIGGLPEHALISAPSHEEIHIPEMRLMLAVLQEPECLAYKNHDLL